MELLYIMPDGRQFTNKGELARAYGIGVAFLDKYENPLDVIEEAVRQVQIKHKYVESDIELIKTKRAMVDLLVDLLKATGVIEESDTFEIAMQKIADAFRMLHIEITEPLSITSIRKISQQLLNDITLIKCCMNKALTKTEGQLLIRYGLKMQESYIDYLDQHKVEKSADSEEYHFSEIKETVNKMK